MELRIKESVRQILLAYPEAKNISWKGFNGFRPTEEHNCDGRLDVLGFDAFLLLSNDDELKVQVKCGTKENFERWGKERQSFTLGNPNDITFKLFKDRSVQFYDLFLTGYELTPGILSPYVLLAWPQLIKRFHEGSITDNPIRPVTTHLLNVNHNAKGRPFCWMSHHRLTFEDLCPTKQFDVKAFQS